MSSLPLDQGLYCSRCNKTFKTNKTLHAHQSSKGHIRRSGGGKLQKYHCRYCDEVFTRPSSRKRHQKTVHWIVDEIDLPPADYQARPAAGGQTRLGLTDQVILAAVHAPAPDNLDGERELINGVGNEYVCNNVAEYGEQQRHNRPEPEPSGLDTGSGNLVSSLPRGSNRGSTGKILRGPPITPTSGMSTAIFRASIRRSPPECIICPGSTQHRSLGGSDRGPMRFRNVKELADHLHHQHIERGNGRADG